MLFADQITDLTETDIDTTWTDVTFTVPKFATKVEAHFRMDYGDGGTSGKWRTNGQTGTTGHQYGHVNADIDFSDNTVSVITDSSQKIEVVHGTSNSSTSTVYTHGWYFPAGV